MSEELDLLGSPVLRRDAVFHHDDRIELIRHWGPGPSACIIGHNPADADATRDDRTSNWWINWCRHYGFGRLTGVNLYPFCSPKPAACREIVAEINGGVNYGARDALHFVNLPAVVAAAKAADQVFVCWGAIAVDDVWIDHVIEEIQSGVAPYPDLWCWGKTKDGSPIHPMARGKHRIAPDAKPILWRAA